MFTLSALLFAAAPLTADARTKLKPEEVRTIFIGKPWENPNGVFLFREDGTYTYQDAQDKKPLGTWPYQMKATGTLKGDTTN